MSNLSLNKKGVANDEAEEVSKDKDIGTEKRSDSGESRIKWRDKKRLLRLEVDGLKTASAPSSPTAQGNCGIFDLTWNEEEARSVKKKKTEEVPPAREPQRGAKEHAKAINRIIKQLDEEAEILVTHSLDRNTKREIKEASKVIRSLASQLVMEESSTLLQTLGSRTSGDVLVGEGNSQQEKMERRIEKLEEDNIRLGKRIEDLANENKKLKESMAKRVAEATGRVTGDMLDKIKKYPDFKDIENLIWPRDIYRAAFAVTGSPLRANKDADLVMLVEEEGQESCVGGNIKLNNEIRERYPEVEEIEGKVGALMVSTRVINREGNAGARENWIMKVELEGGDKECFSSLTELKEMAVAGGRKKLALYAPETESNGWKFRKMIECIFRNTGIKCLIYRKDQSGEKASQSAKVNKKRVRKDEALIFREEGRSYADLLRTFKEKVKPEMAGARAIRTIREARDGSMIVVVNKGASKELQSEIAKIGGLKFRRTAGNEKTIYINEIDGLTTREEVLDAICAETGEARECIQVGELRKSYSKNQAVTVRVATEKALELVRKEGIRIGLSWCPIRERVEVTQCYRCWGFGHIGKECKEANDRSQMCRKCGGLGHAAKNCSKDEYCLTCKKQGHTVGSGKCPEFRKALARRRREEKKKRGY